MRDRRGKPHCIQNRAAANHNDVTATVKVSVIDDLQHGLKNVYVILDRFATDDRLHIAGRDQLVSVRSQEPLNAMLQLRVGRCNRFINPKLNPRLAVFGWFQQFEKRALFVTKNVVGETQSMDKGNTEFDVGVSHGGECAERDGWMFVNHTARSAGISTANKKRSR